MFVHGLEGLEPFILAGVFIVGWGSLGEDVGREVCGLGAEGLLGGGEGEVYHLGILRCGKVVSILKEKKEEKAISSTLCV